MWEYNKPSNNSLQHFGVVGMRWGKRRGTSGRKTYVTNAQGPMSGDETHAALTNSRAKKLKLKNNGEKMSPLAKSRTKEMAGIKKANKSNANKQSFIKKGNAISQISNQSQSGILGAKTINTAIQNKRSKKMDLSNMSDADLKSRIGRMGLEQQYSNLSGTNISKGHAAINTTLDIAGGALAVAGSVAGIAVAIKTLKG